MADTIRSLPGRGPVQLSPTPTTQAQSLPGRGLLQVPAGTGVTEVPVYVMVTVAS